MTIHTMIPNRNLTTTAVLVLALHLAGAAEFHVAPTGTDDNPGTAGQPFQTLERARDAVRVFKQAGHVVEPATVWLHGGTYQPGKTLALESQDSGTEKAPVRWCAAPGETPVVSGGRAIKGWKLLTEEPEGLPRPAHGKVWVADIPKDWRFHYLFVNGECMQRANVRRALAQMAVVGRIQRARKRRPFNDLQRQKHSQQPAVQRRC